MTIEQLLTLVSAGFTKADILALAQAQNPAPTPAQNPAPTPAQEQAPAPTPAQEQAPAPEKSETEKLIEALGNTLGGRLSALETAVHMQNLRQSGTPQEQETTETILAHIINPEG